MSRCKSSGLHSLMLEAVELLGKEVLSEERLRGVLYDLSPEVYNQFRVVLSRSVSYGMAEKILSCRDLDEADFSLKLLNLRQDFQESNFFKPGVSNYIIDCYLFALGVLSDEVSYRPEDDGDKAGELSFADYNGVEYCGNLSSDGLRSGFGVVKEEEGGYYAGEWKLDMKNGYGFHIGENRNRYAGEWRMNRKNGVGVGCSKDGYRYAGEWKNGKPNGLGIIFFPNGEKMFVCFGNGRIVQNPDGIFYMKDGSYIKGNMTENGPDGVCMHFQKDGSVREEIWENGKLV